MGFDEMLGNGDGMKGLPNNIFKVHRKCTFLLSKCTGAVPAHLKKLLYLVMI